MHGHPRCFINSSHIHSPSTSAMRISAAAVRATPSGGDLCTWLDGADGRFVQKHLWTKKVKAMLTPAVRNEIYVSSGCGRLMLMLVTLRYLEEMKLPASRLNGLGRKSRLLVTRTRITRIFAESCLRHRRDAPYRRALK